MFTPFTFHKKKDCQFLNTAQTYILTNFQKKIFFPLTFSKEQNYLHTIINNCESSNSMAKCTLLLCILSMVQSDQLYNFGTIFLFFFQVRMLDKWAAMQSTT